MVAMPDSSSWAGIAIRNFELGSSARHRSRGSQKIAASEVASSKKQEIVRDQSSGMPEVDDRQESTASIRHAIQYDGIHVEANRSGLR